MPLRRLVLTLVAALLASGTQAAELTVAAASSLTTAFKEIGPLFEAADPGTTVRFTFAASGALLQQVSKGAPVDVFASADQASMDEAAKRGLLSPGDRHDIGANRLVVVVPGAARHVPATLADLAQPAYARIAIGVPASVPVGRYTQRTLEQAGLWTAIAPKMIGAQNVRQALDYVARGEVDAGFVYATDAAILPTRVTVALDVPTTEPVRYPAAVVAATPHLAAARRFLAFVRSPAAQAVFARHGFGAP